MRADFISCATIFDDLCTWQWRMLLWEVLMNNVLIKPQTLMIKVILSIYSLSIFYIGTEIPKLPLCTTILQQHPAVCIFRGIYLPCHCCWWDVCTVWESQTGEPSSLQKKSPWFFFHWLGNSDPRRDFTCAFVLVAQKTGLV